VHFEARLLEDSAQEITHIFVIFDNDSRPLITHVFSLCRTAEDGKLIHPSAR
jgi:hypothetical protein